MLTLTLMTLSRYKVADSRCYVCGDPQNRLRTERINQRPIPFQDSHAKDVMTVLGPFYEPEDIRRKLATSHTVPDVLLADSIRSDSDSEYDSDDVMAGGANTKSDAYMVKVWNRELRHKYFEEECSDVTSEEDPMDLQDNGTVISDDGMSTAGLQPGFALKNTSDIMKDQGSGVSGESDANAGGDDESKKEQEPEDDSGDDGDFESDEDSSDDDDEVILDDGILDLRGSGGSSNLPSASQMLESTMVTDELGNDITEEYMSLHGGGTTNRSGMTALTLSKTARTGMTTERGNEASKQEELEGVKRDTVQRRRIIVHSPAQWMAWRHGESCLISWTCYHHAVSHVDIYVSERAFLLASMLE